MHQENQPETARATPEVCADDSISLSLGGQATYSPEDNKLRLYVGRVPREEYLKLRAEGWTSTPKQHCDFVATWTPQRRNTALEYADIIEDEDQGPEDRAADRAERFGEYRDKRTSEATGHADRYDSGPSAHGYQNATRAERSARRHDRIGTYATDAWSKAEYWQRRTAGVISHALYKSTPGVRMGRIKTIEAEQRKHLAYLEQRVRTFQKWEKLAAIEDPEEQTAQVFRQVSTGHQWSEYMHPRLDTVTNPRLKDHPTSLYTLMTMKEHDYGSDDITGGEALALWFSDHSEPATEDDWSKHFELRLAYENQMLEAQGGRAAHVEMVPGGWLGKRQILKVNKSPATGRVVSVEVIGSHTGFTRESGYKVEETRPCPVLIKTERLAADVYRVPTDEELAVFHAERKAKKAAAPKADPCPLINPTDADAERLLAMWNAEGERLRDERAKKNGYAEEFKPATVRRCTQKKYSASSGGTYSSCETRGIRSSGVREARNSNMYNREEAERAKTYGRAICKLRVIGGGGWYTPPSIIILSDKPQKALPEPVWQNPVVAALVNASESFALTS